MDTVRYLARTTGNKKIANHIRFLMTFTHRIVMVLSIEVEP